jgi:hypothetical protein
MKSHESKSAWRGAASLTAPPSEVEAAFMMRTFFTRSAAPDWTSNRGKREPPMSMMHLLP